MAFISVSVVTSSLLLRRWVRPSQSVMPDEDEELLVGNESLWMAVRGVLCEVWDGVRERMHLRGGTRGAMLRSTRTKVCKTIQTNCFLAFFFFLGVCLFHLIEGVD